ncbi:hypothetical protein Daus18300_005036 [Diaporthe australafricana]|uniref:Uncharacterized protein n=1 Tax=Diaporthe australafricana TaxID=127596 RepID=A0ABR3X4T2_9PEZI
MSSLYSLPNRKDTTQHYEDIPLHNLNHPQQTEWPVYQAMQTEGRKKWMTIIILAALAFMFGLATVVLGVLYGICVRSSQTPQTSNNVTVSASTVINTKTLPALISTNTQTLPPVTQTVIHTETDVSSVTTELTMTSVLTTTATTRITTTATTSKDSNDGRRCITDQEIGGQELHDLNDDYDLLMVDALKAAVSNGLKYGYSEYMTVVMRTIFLCSSGDTIEFVEACHSGYDLDDNGHLECNSMGAYPTLTGTATSTATATATATKAQRGIWGL